MHINIKYLVLFVNSFALIVIWDYLRIFVQPFTYCGLLVAGAHHWHIFAFIRTIRHQRMCVSEDKDRGKALSAFCWKKSRWKLRLFSSYGPNHCKLWAPGQGHGMLKKCCRLFCVPEDQWSCQRPRATLIFFRLSIFGLPCVHLHIPSVTCTGITCSPDFDFVLSQFAGHVLLKSTSFSEWNQAFIYGNVWARVDLGTS